MTGDANEVRDLMPSLNRRGSPATCVAVKAWLSNTPSGCLGEEASIDKVGRNPDGYSIASEDQLLMTAQSGGQQAFVELSRRHSPMAKKRVFSIVRSHENAGDVLRVASAVGEGAMAVHLVHRFMAKSTTLRNGATK